MSETEAQGQGWAADGGRTGKGTEETARAERAKLKGTPGQRGQA